MMGLNILLLCGSIRRPSHTLTLVKATEMALKRLGVRTTVWDLLACPLRIADPGYHDDPSRHPDEVVRDLVATAHSSDAFILATPIYHNSYSGVLKNALDNLAIKQFYYKPVGLLSHGGDRSTQAVDHLRIVVRGLLGIAVPSQVCTRADDYSEDDHGYQLESTNIEQRVDRLAEELVFFTKCLRM